MKWSKLVLIICIFGFNFSCNKMECEECPSGIVCTEQFVSINVTILDCENKEVIPDRTETIFKETGEIIFKTSDVKKAIILTDAQMSKIQKVGSNLLFKAYVVNNKGIEMVIVEESYLIGHDCCHVLKISGQDPVQAKGGRCILVPEVGPCNAAIPKYFFDPVDKKCKEFIWGGCAGVVPFNDLKECEAACSCK